MLSNGTRIAVNAVEWIKTLSEKNSCLHSMENKPQLRLNQSIPTIKAAEEPTVPKKL
jgi:hypothetical protein